MLINTFGANKKSRQSCNVVAAGLSLRGGGTLKLYFFAVPLICKPLSIQPLSDTTDYHRRLSGLDLADYCDTTDLLEVDTVCMLIGLNHYWEFVTSKVVNEGDGPIAM